MDCFKTRKKFHWRTSLMGCALSVLLMPSTVWALGMGNIQVKSTLEQPLKAQIELLEVNPQQLDYVRVNLADPALFARLGLQRSELLEQLRFDVREIKPGQYVIEVSTEKPVTEPFLNFLVDVDWGTGRSFREFTILLDPPVFQQGSGAAKVQAPEVVPSRIIDETQTSEVIEPPAVTAKPAIVSEPAAAPVVVDTAEYLKYGPVKRGDMLWNIANDHRPSDVSVNQMMLALLKENPEAFFGDNVNMLKEGAVLRIADADALRAFSTQQAMLEIAKQNKAWLEYRRQRQAATTIASDSAAGQLHGEKSPGQGGLEFAEVQQKHLELVAPEGDDAARAAVASEIQNLEKQIQTLTNQIAMSRENAAAAKEENRELQTRLAALKDQMTAMQSLIALKDQELEMLRAQSVPGEVDRSAEPVLSLETVQERQQLEVTQKKVEAPPSIWRDPLVLGTLGGVAFLVMLLIWLLSRNRQRGQSLEEFDKQLGEIEVANEADSFATQDSHFVSEGALTEIEAVAEADTKSRAISAESELAAETVGAADDLEQGRLMEVDSSVGEAVDPLTEADLYIAYEKYDKANEVLNAALEREPDELTLRLKRLEVLALLKNTEAFEEEAEEMFAALGGDENHPMWQSVLEYSQHVASSNPLLQGGSGAEGDEFVDPAQALIDHLSQADSHIAELDIGDELEEKSQAVTLTEESTALLSELESIASALDEVLDEERSTSYIPVDMALSDSTVAAVPLDAIEQVATSVASVPASEYEELEWQPEGVTELLPDAAISEVELARAEDYNAIREALEEVGLDDHKTTEIIGEPDLEGLAPVEQDVDSMYLLDDEVGSKLDLARAYLEMDETKRAAELLNDVVDEGTEKQRQEAHDLLHKIEKSTTKS